jgi:NADP-dependent 3-hydroxy acid dehydrogenase YdfG
MAFRGRQLFLAPAVVPGMKAAGGGTIVNLSSSAWLWRSR